jgi:diguanylate cyclase (GGDEF)-like protein
VEDALRADIAETSADADQTAADADQTSADADQTSADADQTSADADQTSADADQTSADADQASSDADQTTSTADQATADSDQRASDRDQATADRDHAADRDKTGADDTAYETSRDERETMSSKRKRNRLSRAGTARERDVTAGHRDRVAAARDQASGARVARAAQLARAMLEPDSFLLGQVEELAAHAKAYQERAATDRARAARDRENSARERARLEAELQAAKLDDLTGVYRREKGRSALSHEIDRARRSDGRFVLAFVSVNGLNVLNDRDGDAAGDRVLQTVVLAFRSRLRPLDPIIGYGAAEFVCGLGGIDLAAAERLFEPIGVGIEADAGVSISVGLAALAADETADELTERAHAAMLQSRQSPTRES